MTSVDDLFRKPNTAIKRKLEDPTASFSRQLPNKSAKLSNGTTPRSVSNGVPTPSLTNGIESKAAFVEAEQIDEEDTEAGPSLPPDDIEDENGDDEEGRFFGGGVSKQEREVLAFIDKNEADEVEEKIDSAWLRRTAVSFERKINRNAELRAKYEDDPLKFVASEADLDAEIKNLNLMSEHGDLYKEFVKLGCVGSLVGLLAHENTDIAIAVCELLEELTDEDAGASEEQWRILVDAMIKSDILDLLVSNLGRLDEEGNDNDRSGVYHILSVVENLLSQPQNLARVGEKDAIVQWLVKRISKQDPEARGKVSQNRQYAAEILAILVQGNRKNRDQAAKAGAIDVLLQLLSAYRKRDPERDSDEEEFVENIFDCLTCVVEEAQGADKFLDGEGVELCLIMLREGKLSKSRALKVLDHAMGASNGNPIAVCQRVIEAVGLKTIFGMLMKTKKLDREITEHLIGILSSLLRYLPADSAPRIRTLAKFVEQDYEKIIRLLELRRDYQSRVSKIERDIESEKQGMSASDAKDPEQVDEWFSRRLEAGLFTLQTLDVIFSWLCAEDGGAQKTIVQNVDGGLKTLADSLTTQLSEMDSTEHAGDSAKEMLEALLGCLRGNS